jgi:hypothetical protein
MLDQALADRLSRKGQGFKDFATWAPREPKSVSIPLTRGAGQFRAVGRALTLNSATQLQEGLSRSARALVESGVRSDMEAAARLFRDDYSDQEKPLILVVSSMAGGAGASMTLDVCRLLRADTDLAGASIALFLVTADVFSDQDKLPEDVRRGVKPNALAMLGEIVAAQNGAAAESDADLLSAVGAAGNAISDESVPFDRVFPVSSRVGGGIPLGDGSPEHVYRALGIGLASLMVSGKTALGEFISFDLTNKDLETDGSYFGWGAKDPAALAWGSFGYSTLSMGRHRYEHYAAQRLAATAVERLLHGHESPGKSDHDALDELGDHTWTNFFANIGLPTFQGGATVSAADWWFNQAVFEPAWLRAQADQAVAGQLRPHLEAGGGAGEAWLRYAAATLAERAPLVNGQLTSAVERGVYSWQQTLLRRTQEVFSKAVGDYGLAYAAKMAEALGEWAVDPVASKLRQVVQTSTPPDPWSVSPEVMTAVKGQKVMANGPAVKDRLLEDVTVRCQAQARLDGCGLVAELLVSYAADVLKPLQSALEDAADGLRKAAAREPAAAGTSDLRTFDIQAWPTDSRPLPDRFRQAQNEVLLTDAADFPGQYEVDVPAALSNNGGEPLPFERARVALAGQVVTGQWPVSSGTPAPGGLMTGFETWVSRVFSHNPKTGRNEPPMKARVRLHVTAENLVGRAMALVRRTNDQAFSTYTSVTLRDWLTLPERPEEERSRQELVVTRFMDALEKARPLSNAEPRATQLVHTVSVPRYRFKFSPIPLPEAARDRLAQDIQADQRIDVSVTEQYTNACRAGETSEARDVSIFGSYQPFSPLVFNSLLRPIAVQREQTVLPSALSTFWRYRRARPLAAALPLSRRERQTMAAGWLIGQITGHLLLPERGRVDRPIEIWSERRGGWVPFPHPLLTPPGHSEGPYHFQPYDWFPAVLESVLLAYAYAPLTATMESLAPYMALRSLYDDRAKPTGGLDELRAKTVLVDWLRTGSTPPNGWSRVPGTDQNASPQERAEAAEAWLETGPASVIERDFQRSHDGRGGQFTDVRDRQVAAQMPLFADVWEDVDQALKLVAEQLAIALREIHGDMVPEVAF